MFPNSNMCSIFAIVFKEKGRIFYKFFLQIKLCSTVETYLGMLKIAGYKRETLVGVEPLTFLSILTI